jgi:hypothetical protein
MRRCWRRTMKTMHLNMQKMRTDPGQVLDNLMKDVVNKQSQFIRKVIGTYHKLLLPWHSDGCC